MQKQSFLLKSGLSRICALIITMCLVLSVCVPASANRASVDSAGEFLDNLLSSDNEGLQVGAGIQDITPTLDMLPIAWGRVGNMVGIIENIYVRVIALNNCGETSLIINFETGKGPYPPVFIEELSKYTGVLADNIFWSTTHAHATPEITSDIDLNDGSNISKWGLLTMESMKIAAKEAIDNMTAAEVGIGYTNSYINVNRNTEYTRSDGTTTRAEGFNGEGDSDKLLTAIQFNNRETGDPIAFIVHYAMHNVVMYNNQYFDDDYEGINFTADEKADGTGAIGVHPDVGGLVSAYLEEYYEGSVALWLSGAAGNQNPIIRNNILAANPATGAQESIDIAGGSVEICEFLAKIQFQDVLTALSAIEEYEADTPIVHAHGSTDVPGKEGSSDVTMHVNVMRIGSITLAGNPGELFNAIGVAMRDGSISEHTLVVNHCWTKAEESASYYSDDFGLINGGPNTNAGYAVGYINDSMTDLMNDLILKADPEWNYNGDGTAASNTTGETVIVGLDGIAGTDDDNKIVNPAGKVLLEDVQAAFDTDGTPYVSIGSSFVLYPGTDGMIGTGDDIVKGFGNYPTDTAGTTKESLNWRLLDIEDGQAVLITEKIVDSSPFNINATDGNAWVDSNLRSWLNSNGGQNAKGKTEGFYNSAFTDAEKQLIQLTDVKMDYSEFPLWDTSLDDYNGTTGVYPAYDRVLYEEPDVTSPWVLTTTTGIDTQDYVYAISGEEYFMYFGPGYLVGDGWELANYRDGYFYATDYAKSQGAKVNEGGNGGDFVGLGDAWTRSPGREMDENGNYYGVFWSGTGSMNVGRTVERTSYGIAPMVRVDLGDEGNDNDFSEIVHELYNEVASRKGSEEYNNMTSQAKVDFDKNLEAAAAILAKNDATDEELLEALRAIIAASDLMGIQIGDVTLLAELVAEVEALDMSLYRTVGKSELAEALAAAKVILAKDEPMDNEITATIKNLLNARVLLRYRADTSILAQELSKAQGLDLSIYTEERVAKSQIVPLMAVASKMLEDVDVEQEDVDNMVESLREAMIILEEDDDTSEPGSTDGTENTDGTGGTNGSDDTNDGDNTNDTNDTDDNQQTGDSNDKPDDTNDDNGTAGKDNNTSDGKSKVQTGDTTSVAIIILCMVISISALGIYAVKRRNF